MELDLDMKYDDLLENVHFGLKPPTNDGKSYFVKGLYSYFHYNCDGFKDSVSFVISSPSLKFWILELSLTEPKFF